MILFSVSELGAPDKVIKDNSAIIFHISLFILVVLMWGHNICFVEKSRESEL